MSPARPNAALGVLARRKRAELKGKLRGLTSELGYWKRLSDKAGDPLIRHHSQVRRVAAQMATLCADVEDDFGSGDGVAFIARAQEFETLVLAAHRVWEFFRGKLAQRHVEHFRPYLEAADDFAWACYEPVLKKASGHEGKRRLREPPLVFLNGASTPYMRPRGSEYEAEAVLTEELIDREAFLAALRTLPVPVIGLPWCDMEHLPDALIIAHEIGHLLEDDSQASAGAQAALESVLRTQVPPARRVAWRAWRPEVFADVCGSLAAGPAFVGALADFVALDPDTIAREVRTPSDWGLYPTAFLRVLVGVETLRKSGFEAPGKAIEQWWRRAYGSHAMTAFEPDVKVVVGALLKGPYDVFGGADLRTVLVFTSEMHRQAVNDAAELVDGHQPTAGSPIVLLAAARLAFESDPEAYRAKRVAAQVLARLQVVRSTAPRAREKVAGMGGAAGGAEASTKADADEAAAAARRLLGILRGGLKGKRAAKASDGSKRSKR